MGNPQFEALKSQGQVVAVRILGQPDKVSKGEAVVRQWTPKERMMRSLKAFAIWFAIAALSIAIPILHFILVPLFLIVSFVMAAVVYAHASMVLGGAGTCPYCGAELEIVKKPDSWPLDDVCAKCSRHVAIEKA